MLQVGYDDDPEAALVSFASHAQAMAAYRCSEPLFNNRFIKIFWHNPDKPASSAGGNQSANQVNNPFFFCKSCTFYSVFFSVLRVTYDIKYVAIALYIKVCQVLLNSIFLTIIVLMIVSEVFVKLIIFKCC